MRKREASGRLLDGTYIQESGVIEKCQFVECGEILKDGDAVVAWLPPRPFKRQGSDAWVHRVLWHHDCYMELDERINKEVRRSARG